MKRILITALCATLATAFTPIRAEDSSAKLTITTNINGEQKTQEIDLNKMLHGAQFIHGGTRADEVGPWMGVVADGLSDELTAQLPLKKGEGVLIRKVLDESPAAKAGLQQNDVLVKIDDETISGSEKFKALIKSKKPGDSVKISYLRKGIEQTANATLVEKATGASNYDVNVALNVPPIDINLGGLSVNLDKLLEGALKGLSTVSASTEVTVIGPDGKVISSTGSDLSSEIKSLLQKVTQTANSGTAITHVEVIGPDGKVITSSGSNLSPEIENLLKKGAAKVTTSVTVAGPDGKVTTTSGEGVSPEIERLIEKAKSEYNHATSSEQKKDK